MKRYQYLSDVFLGLAVLLSDVMCAVVAYSYRSMEQCLGCSAPPSVAFVYGIPFGIGILICAVLAWWFRRIYGNAA